VTHAKLQFLLEIAQLERAHLGHTDGHLFLQPMTSERDPTELAQALQAAHEAVPMLFAAVDQFALASLRFAPTAGKTKD
jgi:hypothetical protein